jgi:hypothetical protein
LFAEEQFARAGSGGCGWRTNGRRALADPGSELLVDYILVCCLTSLLEKGDQVGRGHQGERLACQGSGITLIRPQNVKGQGIALQAPNFRDTQRSVNRQAIERTVSDIAFYGEIGWWVSAEVKTTTTGHPRGIGDPETFIGLNASLAQPPPKGR